jgi:hypothetical protein
MKRIYIYTDSEGIATPYETLTDLCTEHGCKLSTVRNALQSSNIYTRKNTRTGATTWTVNDTHLRESTARKRPGNSRNWAKKED